jgi:dienelactone hydrolase
MMGVYKVFIIVALAAVVLFASKPNVSITGTVIDNNVPLAGAMVSLVSDSTIADTTGADGTFKLVNLTSGLTPSDLQVKNDIKAGIRGTSLYFTLSRSPENGAVSLFSGSGQRVVHMPMQNPAAGSHHVALPELGTGIFILTMNFGNFSMNRALVSVGSACYLKSSGDEPFSAHGTRLAQAQSSGDKLKIQKNGYLTKTVDITGYRIENLQIALQKEGTGPCNGGKWATTDVSKKGPFETVTENVTDAILYRPKELLTGCLYPVITWGHGAGGSPSNYTTVLAMMASHGFVVIASSAGNVQDGGNSGNQFRNKMVEAAQWVVKQNSTSSSVLYHKIDTAKIGAAGHSQGGYGASEAGQNPLIRATVSISGAVGSPNQKGPAFIICGGRDTYSGARCEDHPTASYNGTSGVPVFFGKCLSADHGNWGFESMLSDKTKPSDVVQAMTAWFRYHLMADTEYRSWFYGADCTLCKHSNWSVQRKGMD